MDDEGRVLDEGRGMEGRLGRVIPEFSPHPRVLQGDTPPTPLVYGGLGKAKI